MKCPTCGQKIISQNRTKEKPASILDDYETKKVKIAVPKVSDYRERYKKRKIRIDDISAKPTILKKATKQDGNLDRFTYKGESLFFGEGLTQEY